MSKNLKKTTKNRAFYRVMIRKEALKFSAAHMTVFPDGTKESLHGHNYMTSISLTFKNSSFAHMLGFRDIKNAMKEICEDWDEKVLLPEFCPFFSVLKKDRHSIDFQMCKKRYVLPLDEIALLPVENITTEGLALEFCNRLAPKLKSFLPRKAQIISIETLIEEITGQGASYTSFF